MTLMTVMTKMVIGIGFGGITVPGTAFHLGQGGLESGAETGIDPSIDQRVVGSMSHGEPMTCEVDVNQIFGGWGAQDSWNQVHDKV